jgi:hypothetical protein
MDRSYGVRLGRRAAGALLLVALLPLPSRDSQAGILRDVMSSMGLSSPTPGSTGAAKDVKMALPRQGYACCVLHYDGDWISDTNYSELPMVPAGTPIEVLSYGRNRAFVKVDGKPMRLGHDNGRDQESLDAWVNKMVVAEDPRPRFASYPPDVQEAIRLGKVAVGMTREQVIVALGYPVTNENISMDAPSWKLYRSRREEYQLNFGRDGRVTSITGDDGVTSAVTYRPGN